jgi:DNA-directed RNA polymerase specialized sigma24 family protein
MWAGYDGDEWEELADRLIADGYAVISAWLRKGLIFDRCARRGCLLKATVKSRERDEADSLAGETVVISVIKFRETVLIPRVWRPDGGASLETFFVGQCLIRFANVYRRWLKENGWGGADALDDVSRRRSDSPLHLVAGDRQRRRYGDPEAALELDPYLDLAEDPVTKAILAYVADDFTYEEIAQLLETSVGAIKSRLYRLRQAQRVPRKGGNDVA